MDFQTLTSYLLSNFRTLYEDALIAYYAESKTEKEIRFQFIKNGMERCQTLIKQFEEEQKRNQT